VNIKVSEVLRYLGYKNQIFSESTQELIDACIKEAKELVRESYIYRFYDIDKTSGEIHLVNTNVILEGKDIYEHLENSNRCVILALTAGSILEFKIRYLEKANLTKALVLDACATVAIESLCDEVEEKIKKEAFEAGYGITDRYSPGYGDLSIKLQPLLLNLLDAQKKIGLTANENFILLPRKSVTAIIGLQTLEQKRKQIDCRSCSSFQYCEFRKEGSYYGT
jgi:hypothetical protein